MKKALITSVLLAATVAANAQADERELVEMPAMMQQHMLANMRDHLAALDEINRAIAAEEFTKAAEVAEQRLGMSSLDDHGAAHMAPMMPQTMREIGTGMHKAASKLARTLEEGDAIAAWGDLAAVTAQCVACHSGYRVH
jgi:cytochrome c556